MLNKICIKDFQRWKNISWWLIRNIDIWSRSLREPLSAADWLTQEDILYEIWENMNIVRALDQELDAWVYT